MSTFNLKFWGEILTGHDPVKVKQQFGRLFGIDDPERLEKFFSGETIILRRNLERKVAAEYYAKLRQLGVEAELVKLEPPRPAPEAEPSPAKQSSREARRQAREQRRAEAADRRAAEIKEREREAAQRAAQLEADQARRDQETAEKARERQAQEAERERLAAAEAARRREEEAERKQLAAEEAALRQAAEAERQRQAAEEAEQERERQRLAAEEMARKRAAAAAEKKRAAQERERQRAEQRRQREEERARLRAEREEQRRLAAEEAARKRAQEQERKRLAAQAAAAKRAEEQERKQREAEEQARIRAERRQQREAERARIKAEREEKRRLAAEEAARRRVEAEERKRQAEEEAARRKAEQERRHAEAAQAAARQRALEEEQQRAAAAEAAQRKAEQQREEEEAAARVRAEQAAAAREQRAREEQARREAAAELAQQQARAEAEQREQAAQRRAMEAQAIARGAQELGRQNVFRSGQGGVRTALAVPARRSSSEQLPRKRQPGEPNLYSLEPFRNTPEIKDRPVRAQRGMVRAFRIAAVALVVLLILCGRFLSLAPAPPVVGPQDMAINPGSGPVLLAGGFLLLHDRSGAGIEALSLDALGLQGLRPPLAFAARDQLFAQGLLQTGASDAEGDAWTLLRCDLANKQCQSFLAAEPDLRIDGLAVHPLSGAVFVADAGAGELLKFDPDGKLAASTDVSLPSLPVLRLQSGLLFVNSASEPAINVFRYEDATFGAALEQVPLLPPAAVNTGQSRTGNFIRAGDSWWVTLYNPEDGNGDLFRFDADWNFVEELRLLPGQNPDLLADWETRLLVADRDHLEIQRFSTAGLGEAPLESTLLADLVAQDTSARRLNATAWRLALAACAILLLAAVATGLFLRMRSMVYRTSRERGAEPVDDLLDELRWIDPMEERDAVLKRRTNIYLMVSMLALGAVVTFAVHPSSLIALLIALAGPALALALLRRDPAGNIGVADQQLLLVDHRNIYHLGSGSRIQYRGSFLLIDDVVVFTGNTLAPAFVRYQVESLVGPLRNAGVRVDRTTVAIKLLQARHALAVGALCILASSALALTIVVLARF